MNIESFGNTAKDFAKNPLGIIALFIVLIYGFAALVVGTSTQLQPDERFPVILFLVFFPIVVIVVFTWLVVCHHSKLYAPCDYKNDESFLQSISAKKNEISEIANVIIKVAYILADGSGRWGGPSEEHLNKVKKYEKQIGKYLSDDLHKKIQEDINEVNKIINSRITQKNIGKSH